MKIYGLKLNKGVRYVHPDFSDECEEGEVFINPEETISPACHLYEDDFGIQYIGFEISLALKREDMDALLQKKGKLYTVAQY